MNCKICGSDKIKSFFVKSDNTGLAKCLHCGVFFTEPIPSQSLINDFYNKSDYFNHWFKYKNVKLETDKLRFENILNYHPNPCKLLDFGCGPGFFLNIAKSNGLEVNGVEFSDFAINYAKNEFNIKIDKFTEFPLKFEDSYFDTITVWHTLEHLHDPKTALSEFRRILNDKGIIIIEVPNINGLLTILRGKKSLPLIEHLFHFNVKSLSILLEKSGLKIISATPGRPGYTRTGFKIFIKKALAKLGILIFNITGINFGDTILIYCKKKTC
ncbi:class I SAM-dependent methyltransferase [Candidatus Dependentiae bacterium]|nr:class I SAM-dependent methyltransferase [Candidatus Dependentiae bacterium]